MSSTYLEKEANHKQLSPYHSSYMIFHIISSFFAMYLSFKCNNGFNHSAFFVAVFFPYIYIIYEYALSKSFCGLKNM